MDYNEFKRHFAGYQIVGATLFHMWDSGMSVEEAQAKLKVRGVSPGSKWRGRGISNTNMIYALSKHMIQFCQRMEARQLSEQQKAFIAELRERAEHVKPIGK